MVLDIPTPANIVEHIQPPGDASAQARQVLHKDEDSATSYNAFDLVVNNTYSNEVDYYTSLLDKSTANYQYVSPPKQYLSALLYIDKTIPLTYQYIQNYTLDTAVTLHDTATPTNINLPKPQPKPVIPAPIKKQDQAPPIPSQHTKVWAAHVLSHLPKSSIHNFIDNAYYSLTIEDNYDESMHVNISHNSYQNQIITRNLHQCDTSKSYTKFILDSGANRLISNVIDLCITIGVYTGPKNMSPLVMAVRPVILQELAQSNSTSN